MNIRQICRRPKVAIPYDIRGFGGRSPPNFFLGVTRGINLHKGSFFKLFSNAVSRIRPTTATPTGLRPATPDLRPPLPRACGPPLRAYGPPLRAYGPHPGGPAAK
eukprot:1193168-Prorocentrum_minimum.AAC.1